MAIYWIGLVSLFGVVWGNGLCPEPADVKPCTCDVDGINCMKAKSVNEIKKAFGAKFGYNFARNVWIQGTPIDSIPDDLFGPVSSPNFNLDINQIATVDLNAFRASKESLLSLSLYSNKIVNFPFSDLKQFTVLETLNLASNLIETVPENALQLPTLGVLMLTNNRIKHIGSNAFVHCVGLQKLELSFNQLDSLGPLSIAVQSSEEVELTIGLSVNKIKKIDATAFKGTTPSELYLHENKLTYLDEEVFKDLFTRIIKKEGKFEVGGNPFNCFGCGYAWLVENKEIAEHLKDLRCPNGRTVHDLTKENIGCRDAPYFNL